MSEKKEKNIKETIAQIFLGVFVLMFICSNGLLQGDYYIQWLIFMGGSLIPTLLLGSQKIRIFAALGLLVTFIMMYHNYQDIKACDEAYWKKMKKGYNYEIDRLNMELEKYKGHNK